MTCNAIDSAALLSRDLSRGMDWVQGMKLNLDSFHPIPAELPTLARTQGPSPLSLALPPSQFILFAGVRVMEGEGAGTT